jgi:diguanylate cyclase (GGDEF)-like protein/PAS domain S-box-containing protein
MVDSLADNRAVALVVDDDPAIRMLIAESLRQKGFLIREAESGEEATEQVASHPPDIILLDVEMPGMDGFDTCRSLRATRLGHDLPIVMVTGHDDIESVDRAFEVGATDFVSKPVNWAMLGHRIRYILRSSRSFRALKESEARLAEAQHIAGLGHWEWQTGKDSAPSVVNWSEQVYYILGLNPASAQPGFRAFYRRIPAPDRAKAKPLMRALLRTGEPVGLECRIQQAGGEVRVVYGRAKVICDEQGVVQRLLGTVQDITERKQAEKRIHQLAYYDNLTGLPNRLMFREYLGHAITRARRSSQKLAVLFLDIDDFKRVNDTLGHQSGDVLLQEVAERLSKCLRESDYIAVADDPDKPSGVLARQGGDEFIILLPDIKHVHDPSAVANRLIESLLQPIDVNGHECYTSASIGISMFPSDGDQSEDLIKNADNAMYYAKAQGKNGYQYFQQSMNTAVAERLALETRLRKAIENNQFALFYQAQVDAAKNEVIALEALLRWRDPESGLIPPNDFIPVAEQTGLIIPIGEWVLYEACRQGAAWQKEGYPRIRISVNVSTVQFSRDDFINTIQRALTESEFDPTCLEIEITESAIMVDTRNAADVLADIKALGVSIALDDFGTGYSSLNYLRRFPIDTVKVDRSFIKDIDNNPEDEQIVAAIVAMAHAMNLRVVAEGVETQDQFRVVCDNDCDLIQGFLFSQPAPAAQIFQGAQNQGIKIARDLLEQLEAVQTYC